jgi:hypothetical protein
VSCYATEKILNAFNLHGRDQRDYYRFADGITEVYSEGKSILARTFSLLHIADWLSFFLAVVNGVDTNPVREIDFLKEELAK